MEPASRADNWRILKQDRKIAKKPNQRTSERSENEIIKNGIDPDKTDLGKQLVQTRAINEDSADRVFRPAAKTGRAACAPDSTGYFRKTPSRLRGSEQVVDDLEKL